jgi:hypothetical protein
VGGVFGFIKGRIERTTKNSEDYTALWTTIDEIGHRFLLNGSLFNFAIKIQNTHV